MGETLRKGLNTVWGRTQIKNRHFYPGFSFYSVTFPWGMKNWPRSAFTFGCKDVYTVLPDVEPKFIPNKWNEVVLYYFLYRCENEDIAVMF